jgi:hypothetical protein
MADPANGLSLAEVRASVSRVQANLWQSAAQLLDLDARRAWVLTSLEEQATRLVGGVLRSLNVASCNDAAALSERIAALERRIDALARANAESPPRAAVGS